MTKKSQFQSEEEFYQFAKEKLETIEEKLTRLERETNNDLSPIDNATFCQMYKITDRTALEWRNSGLIKFFKSGKNIYYRRKDIEQFMKQQKINAEVKKTKSKKLASAPPLPPKKNKKPKK